jgi:hypothetical protein
MSDGTHAIKIRDEAFERLVPLMINGRVMKSARKAPITTIQPEQLPALGVFILSEREEQLGGGKGVTLPQFEATLDLGLSWVVMATDDMLIDGSLDQFVSHAKRRLLSDPDFLELYEFTAAVTRDYNFSKVGEAYIAEIRVRLQVTYKTFYPPFSPFDLEIIDIKTVASPGDTPIEVQIPIPVAPADPDDEED